MSSLRFGAPSALVLTLAGLLVADDAGISAQSPQSQPLVQESNVVHLGEIYAPAGLGVAGQHGMAVDGNTWYFGCAYGVAVLTLPPLGGTGQVTSYCTPFPNIEQVHPTDRNVQTGGVLPWLGRIITSGYVYYDGNGDAIRSHWAGATPSTLAGPYKVGTGRPGMVAGYMGVIPPEWRALFGGPALTGQCCIPVIWRSSFGPSVSVFDPALLDARASPRADAAIAQPPVPSTMVIGYPNEHRNLGEWDANPPNYYYGGTDQLGAVAFPAGTRSILFTGRHGEQFCYGPGTWDPGLVGTPGPGGYPYCLDPLDHYQGNHGPSYRPTMWAYDANDVLAVKQGTKQPWDVYPYAKWTLPGIPGDWVTNLLRAGYYDQATRRLYVGSTDSLTVHVFEITNAIPAPPAMGPTSLNVEAGARELTFSWTPPSSSGWSHYALEVGTSPGAADAGVLPVASSATNLTLAAPGPGTFYVRLRAVYADGADPSSNEIQVVVGAAGGPAPPANFRATAAGAQITLAWDPVVDGSVTDVIAEAGSGPGLSNVAKDTSLGNAGSYVMSNVPAGHYYLRARTVGVRGTGAPTDDIEVVVSDDPPPSRPLDLAASVNADRSVELTWRAGSGGGTPSQFVAEVGSQTGLANLGTLPLGVGTRFVSPAVPARTYYIRLRAENAHGVSASSNEVRVVVP